MQTIDALLLLSLLVTASVTAAATHTQHAHVVCDTDAPEALLRCRAGTHRVVATNANGGGASARAPAWGSWSDAIGTTGWATIAVHTNASYASVEQVYSAGYLEGALSHTRIAQHFANLFQMQLDGAPDADAAYTRSLAFVHAQYHWTQQQIAANPTHPRWLVVNLTLTQLQGMADGYMSARNPDSEQPLALIDFLWSQSANDDMAEVMGALFPETTSNCWDTALDRALSATRAASHCSALIKPLLSNRFQPLKEQARSRHTATYDDLIVAHNSWFDYRVMLRVIKSYRFALFDTPAEAVAPERDAADAVAAAGATGAAAPQRSGAALVVRVIGDYAVLFSSYPGFVWSQDDYYQIQAKAPVPRSLYVMETTNTVCNASLLSLVRPESLFTWQRTLVANALAVGGRDWTEWFAPFNSGTYNNQMMIVDFGQFVAGERTLRDGLLWISEQMPGAVFARDVTDHLRVDGVGGYRSRRSGRSGSGGGAGAGAGAGYWASFNVPFLRETWEGLGYAKTAAVYGDEWTHDRCARARLFARDQHAVVDVDSAKALERSNRFATDPLSRGDPFLAIAARGDLVPDNGGVPWVNRSAVGCVDAKVTDAAGMRAMSCHAVCGPPTSAGRDQRLPPFAWSGGGAMGAALWGNHAHAGQPDVFDFGWTHFDFGRT